MEMSCRQEDIGHAPALRERMQGFFERLPDSLLHTFVLSLPPEDRLSLVRTSKWLAGAVICNTPSVKLSLKPEPDSSSPWYAATRSTMMARLLDGCKEFHVTLTQRSRLSHYHRLRFPHGLARHITKLSLVCGDIFKFTGDIDWAALTSLQHLICNNITLDNTLYPIWQALKPDHLPQLRSFTCISFNSGLQRAHVLPALREVSIRDWQSVFEGTHTHCKCSWHFLIGMWLTLGPAILSRLPLDNLHEITFLSRVSPVSFMVEDIQALEYVLKHHSHRLVCQPHEGRFTFIGLSHEAVQLVKFLQEACELKVEYAPEDLLLPLCAQLPACVHTLCIDHPAQLQKWPQVLRALPASVHSLYFTAVHGIDWERLWLDMPSSISTLGITSEFTDFVPCMLNNMVSTAPSHIKRLILSDSVFWSKNHKAIVISKAPSHLTLTFRQAAPEETLNS